MHIITVKIESQPEFEIKASTVSNLVEKLEELTKVLKYQEKENKLA